MPPATKTLSPAELAKLEHAFATDPASDAYKPLAEAYLGMGRFMEAMVVCKKGVKAHPSTPDARLLLARVYADQGKDKKALEELQGAVQIAPNDKGVLRMMGSLQLKGGEADAGKANLLKAFEADPSDADTIAAFNQYKLEVPKPKVVEAPAAVTEQELPLQQVGAAPQQPAQTTRVPSKQGVQAATRVPSQARPAVQRPVVDYDEPVSSVSNITDISELRRRASRAGKSSGTARALFFLLIVAVPVAASVYYGYGQWRAQRLREVKKLINEAKDAFDSDTFASYKKACELGESALNLDPQSNLAFSYLSYAYTVRWGEHERNDEIKKHAIENLAEAKKTAGEPNSHHLAAEALFAYYDGKGAEARKSLEALVAKYEGENKRPSLLQLTLGIIQMNQGDLELAKETLERSQANSPTDPRVYVALGNLNRRRGNDAQALTNFNTALKYTKNSHPDALLGTALLILDQDNPAAGFISASKYLSTLLDSDPPPSPRQLALGKFVRAFLVSRVSTEMPQYTNKEFQKQLEEGTKITADQNKARAEVQKLEDEALTLDRSNPELYVVRGKRLAFEGKLDEAAAELRKAIDMNPGMAQYHVELAKVYLKKEGGEPQAVEALRKALTLVPGSPKLLSMLGQALYKQKKIDEARDTLEKAVADQKSKNPESRYLLGRIYRDDKKDLVKAAALFEKAAAEYYSDPSMAANAYDDLATTYDQSNDKDRARANFEKSLSADKEFGPVYCHFAKFLVRGNDPKDKDRIKALATDSLKLDPKGECANDMTALAK